MTKISYSGYRFPPEIIHQSIWLYLRFALSFRDVEDLFAERGIAISYETVRRWVNHFGPIIAAELRKRRPKPHSIWHLDEVYLKIDGRMVYLWRAVDAEGEILDVLVQSKRNKHAALKLMRKLLRRHCHINRFYWSVLTPSHEPVSISQWVSESVEDGQRAFTC
jgi:transposase-like protein